MNNFGVNDDSVAQTFVAQTDKQAKLAAAIALYRYNLELKMIEDEIAGNSPIPTQNDSKVKRAIIDGTVNAFRRKETQRLSKKKTQCLDNISAFLAKCKADGIELADVDENAVRQMADEYFASDNFGLQKISFAMYLCLQDDPEGIEYVYGDATMKNVSNILFGDAMRIRRIKEKFYENYKELSNGDFWERNKYFIIGTGVSIALVAVLTPIALGATAASSAVVTSCLAQLGHAAPGLIGAGIARVTGMAVLGSALFGGAALATVGFGELIRSEQTKEAFRKLQPSDVAALLAMKATLIDFGKPLMDDEKCKKELDECLMGLNDFRSDAEYMLIVEKCDAENSKKKIQICNRFVNRLALIAGI